MKIQVKELIHSLAVKDTGTIDCFNYRSIYYLLKDCEDQIEIDVKKLIEISNMMKKAYMCSDHYNHHKKIEELVNTHASKNEISHLKSNSKETLFDRLTQRQQEL